MTPFVIALVGNPNSGKTTLFNTLTGKQQEVGNWCGVTVEEKRGWLQGMEASVEVVDLPGCYHCLSNVESPIDEQITADYLASGKANLILNVVSATQLERHLYLTLQLLEQGFQVVVVLNMMDDAKKQSISIDINLLSKKLGCPVIPLTATKKQGIIKLRKAIVEYKDTHASFKQPAFPVESSETHIHNAQARYTQIQAIVEASVRQTNNTAFNWTEHIDRIVLNRFLGIPFFLSSMYLVFVITMHVGSVLQDFFDISSYAICMEGMGRWLAAWHVPAWLIDLMVFGVGQGINTTLSFVPIIAGMFFSLSFLEASGYMARIAFVMDKIMQWIGLPGKSFVPMIIGFGCNVPAVLATRTLENYRERVLTVLMSPFMSCGARLAIYALFVSAFFPTGGQNIIFALYLIGILIALLTGFVLRTTILSGERSALLIELPPYRWPNLLELYRTTWQKLKRFVAKAGVMIIALSVIIGAWGELQDTSERPRDWLAMMGRKLTPIFSPMGIKEDNWPATVGLLTGIVAKEVVVGTLNALYLQEERRFEHPFYKTSTGSLQAHLKEAFESIPANWSRLKESFRYPFWASMPKQELNEGILGIMVKRFGSHAAAFSYLVFVLLYFPCISVVATIAKELNRAWAIFSVVWTTSIAYMAAVLCYQIAMIKIQPMASISWIIGILLFWSGGFYGIRKVVNNKKPSLQSKKPFPTKILVLDN